MRLSLYDWQDTFSLFTFIWTQALCIAVQIIAWREVLSASRDRLLALHRYLRLLFSSSPKRIDIFSFVDLLSGTIFSAARKSLTIWQSTTFSISWNLSGHFTHRYPSDSYPQTLEITLHWITASSFLENVIGLVSIGFKGFDFVATFHCNLFYWCLRDIVILINAPVHSQFLPAVADLRSKRLWEYQRGLSLGELSMCAFLRFKLHWSSTVISQASVVPADQFRFQSTFRPCSLRRRKPSNWVIVFWSGIPGGGRWLVILLNLPTHWLLLKLYYNFFASVTSRRDCWCVLQRVLAGSQFVVLLSEKSKSIRKEGTEENWKAPFHVSKCFPYTMEMWLATKNKSFIFLLSIYLQVTSEDTTIYSTS